jgi:hypothetical protein
VKENPLHERVPLYGPDHPRTHLGRLLLEHPGVSLRHAEWAAAYLAAWADPARRDAASEALGELRRAVGLVRPGARKPAPAAAERPGYDRLRP